MQKTKDSPRVPVKKSAGTEKAKRKWSEADAFKVLKRGADKFQDDTPGLRKIKKFVDAVESLHQ